MAGRLYVFTDEAGENTQSLSAAEDDLDLDAEQVEDIENLEVGEELLIKGGSIRVRRAS